MLEKRTQYILILLILLNIFFLSATIAFQVTRKGETVTVPDLLGVDFEEARDKLTKYRLFLIQTKKELHDSYDENQIISQEPPSDSRIRLNQPVKVVVSAGRETVIVPNLIGRTLESILSSLGESGVRKGRISHVHTPRYAAGKIISQSPSEGIEVAKNSFINLLVSQGDRENKYLMPDLLGKKLDLVRPQLESMGFSIGDIRRSVYYGLESGIIIWQEPKQGDRIQKNNIIRLEVSK